MFYNSSIRTILHLLLILSAFTLLACASEPTMPEQQPIVYEPTQVPTDVSYEREMPKAEIPDVATIQIYYQAKGLHKEAKKAIKEYVDSLETPELLRFTVEGHTCNQGFPAYNRKLSLWRAQAVKDYMVELGIDPYYIDTLGHGSDYPAVSNATQMGRVKNRRVTITAEER